MTMSEKWIPEIMTPLKQDIVKMPEIIRQASGIKIFGRKIKSIIFTTDIAIIRNTDAQAVIAVYPFTPHPAITKGIIEAADIPVFSGVGGGLTQGMRSAYMSLFAEAQGSMGVVLNGPTPIETIKMVDEAIDIPIISTVTSIHTPIDEKLAAGVDMINISAGKDTAATVRYFQASIQNYRLLQQEDQLNRVFMKPLSPERMLLHIRPLVTVNYSAKK